MDSCGRFLMFCVFPPPHPGLYNIQATSTERLIYTDQRNVLFLRFAARYVLAGAETLTSDGQEQLSA